MIKLDIKEITGKDIEGEEEIFRDVIGNEYRYSVTNLGRIYSKNRQEFLATPVKKGYKQAHLTHEIGKHCYKLVHRLVAKHFVPNPNNYSEINHINNNKLDNRAKNLEWCTRSYNMKQSYQTGSNTRKGSNNSMATITENIVKDIYIIRNKINITDKKVNEITGISVSVIYGIRTKRSWKETTDNIKLNEITKEYVNEILNKYEKRI